MSPEARERAFDALATEMASGTLSRGKALRLMGGLLVGSALASLPGVAWADDDDDRCPEGQTRCGERCVNLKTNERHCGRCRNRCGSNQTCCNGRCVNLQRNENHCGRCFNRCAEGEECVSGECTPTCGAIGATCTEGTQCCSGNCVNAPNGTCACKPHRSTCNNNSECCSGYCNQFGICDQNVVECACQDGFIYPNVCTMAACSDTTALNQLCNSFCLSAGRGSGVAGECFLGGCGN